MPKGFVIDGPAKGAVYTTTVLRFIAPGEISPREWEDDDEPHYSAPPITGAVYDWSPLCGGIWYSDETSLALIEELTPEIIAEKFRGPKIALPGVRFGFSGMLLRSYHWKRRAKQWPRDGFTLQYGLHNRSFTLLHWQRNDLRAKISYTAGVELPPAMTEAFRESLPPETIAKCIAASIELGPVQVGIDSGAVAAGRSASRHPAPIWPRF